MGVDKFNHEGYFDPTTYEALSLIWISLNVRLLHRKVCHLLS